MSENKTGRYLKYAIGEIILVMIGILLALQVNNWNNNRIDRSNERKILLELKKGLELDKEKMHVALKESKVAVEKMKRLKQLLNNKDHNYSKDLDELFGQVYGIRKVFLNRAFYEDLKASGLRIINNERIRLQIVQLFEENYVELSNIFNFAEPSVNDVTRPYYLKNFENIDFKDSATPTNFNFVWNDTYYHNIVDYRIIGVEGNHIAVYSKTIPVVEQLIDSIDTYLF